MNRKFNPVIVVGALLAVAGVAVLVGLAAKDDNPSANGTVRVVVATAAIAAGTPAGSAAIEVQDVAAGAVPNGSLIDPAAIAGQVALRPIAKGEVVAASAFGAQGVAAAGGVRLPAGKEGLGVELAFAPGGLRYVLPGNKITVWSTPKVKEGEVASPRAILQDILVIATTPGAGTGAATEVTAGPGALDFLLAVTRAEAASVIGAQASGASLYFTLASTDQQGG